MTVKEAMDILCGADEVNLSFNGNLICFNFRNEIEIDTWGDFMVCGICAMKEGVFELVLAAQPVRKVVAG